MNKTKIKNFAVWAREKLIDDIKYKAKMIGITDDGISEKLPQSTNNLHFYDVGTKDYSEISGIEIKQREALVNEIKSREENFESYKEAFESIVEETAYTWFNRLIAIRFMEVNDYLPSGVRVLSSENKDKNEPDFVTKPFETDLEFTSDEYDKIIKLKDENKPDELFRKLFIKQCNKLHEILPELFEKLDDYSELLLTISFTDKDGIVYRLVHGIEEDDFNIEKEGQVEIIGWLYQYYNIEPKAKVFAKPKGEKISKEEIPAATQLFTPDWIVRYMVENSLGRLWQERNMAQNDHDIGHWEDNNYLRCHWKYYIEEAEQEENVQRQLEKIRKEYKNITPESIKVIDPCMGSGHILVYAFDILMQIYESCGYTQREASRNILNNNIYGFDIDKRAYQLTYFAIMMKARQYNRRILTEGIKPNVYFIENSKELSKSALDRMGEYKDKVQKLITEFKHADEYGSIINTSLSENDLQNISNQIDFINSNKDISNLHDIADCNEIDAFFVPLLRQVKLLKQKYDVVITNPPYMPTSNGKDELNKYIKQNYPDSKTDLFAVFIERCKEMLKANGYQAMITMHSWMFLSSYEKLREKILLTDIVNMAHLGARAFEEIGGEVVQTTSFVMRKSCIADYKGVYCRLIEPNTQNGKEEMFLSKENRYNTDQSNFSKIPGLPIAYWVSRNLINAFSNKLFYDYTISDGQNKTGNNAKFVRYFWEVKNNCIGKNKKWLFYAKGGGYRKWVGNLIDVVDWSLPTREFYKKDYVCRIIPEYLWYKKGITWGLITSSLPSFRILPEEATFDVGGSSIFFKDYTNYNYFLGLLNSKVFLDVVKMLNPTLNFQVKDIRSMPIIIEHEKKVNEIVENTVICSEKDWNSFEISWNFKKHPLLGYGTAKASIAFEIWTKECDERFNQLKANEEELNRIFIDIYGLQDELTPEVDDKDVTVRKADLQRNIKSLISYAVGCMFGRYSLAKEGLIYAGGDWNEKFESYKGTYGDLKGYTNGELKHFKHKQLREKFYYLKDENKKPLFCNRVDYDNIIPITDEEYFHDDIVGLFCDWLEKAYGTDTLEENLDFIATALGNKGNTSREIIRNYFLKDFIKDHNKIYQKRPIYWLFDSGKQNGFKALVYMHRWNADTIGNVRVEYLHRIQRVYEQEVERMQEIIENSHNNKEISNATKRKEKLQKQIKETKEYDAKIAHLALSRIDIDLDDGVKVNYEKVQTADGKKMQILAKI